MNYLVAGLGNIGAEYAGTRHNMGFMVLDAWAQASNIVFEQGRYGSTASVSFKGRKFILLKPSTYMNLSGKAVRYWMNELKIPAENLMVISDDLNIPFGTLRLRKKRWRPQRACQHNRAYRYAGICPYPRRHRK